MELKYLPTTTAVNRLQSLRWISFATMLLVTLLATCSFILSFDALCDLAIKTQAIVPGKAALLPICVDGGIIVFSVAACRCTLLGEDKRWPVTMVLVSTALSICGNIAHGQGGFVSALISAIPPTMNFLALETLMKQIESHYCLEVAPQGLAAEEAASPPPRAVPGKALCSKKTPQKALSTDRRAEVAKLLAEGCSKRSVAKRLSVAASTVRRIAATL